MSRRSQKGWRNRAVAEVLASAIETLPEGARVLVAYDETGTLAPAIETTGRQAAIWNRRLAGALTAMPWPQSGPFDAGMLRLPQARDEQEMALHAVASVIRPGGHLLVCGANDEGIKVATPRIARLLGNAEKMTARAHCRLISAERPATVEGLLPTLSDWRRSVSLDLGDGQRDWVFYPGIFAEGRIDEGTALLLEHLPEATHPRRILDYGAGSGIIAAHALRRWPDAVIDMMDIDTVALTAARENVPGANAVLGAKLGAVGAVRYDLILSNPPIHAGHEETHRVLEEFIATAPRHLSSGGMLQIVVQRRIALDALMSQAFQAVTCVAETGLYRVWHASLAID